MGMCSIDLKLVNDLRERGLVPDGARVLEIGAQQLSNDFLRSTKELARSAALFRTETPPHFPDPLPTHILPGGLEHQPAEAPYARTFWNWVGLESQSIDIDGSPGAKAIDLNSGRVPVGWRQRFDLVMNLGTTEHLVDQENAFKVMHDAMKPGGIMIHRLPTGGFHGLLSYTPRFFLTLAAANRYRWHMMNLYAAPGAYTVPPKLLARLAEFDPDAPSRLASYTVGDSTILVALERTSRRKYLTPLDVPGGRATTLLARLRYRYQLRTRARQFAGRVNARGR